MAKKFGKILAVGAFIGAAVLGGIAYYRKSKTTPTHSMTISTIFRMNLKMTRKKI